MPTFKDPGKEAFSLLEMEKTAFSPFPTMFSTQSVTLIIIWTTFKMSSTNAFKLDWSWILLFGKELNCSQVKTRAYLKKGYRRGNAGICGVGR